MQPFLSEFVKRKIDDVSTGIITANRWKLENRQLCRAPFYLNLPDAGKSAHVVMEYGILVDESFVPRFHDTIAILSLAPIKNIIGVGQSDASDCRQSVQTARPDDKVAGIVAHAAHRSAGGRSPRREQTAVLRVAIR